MASAAEQLAANINFGAIAEADELRSASGSPSARSSSTGSAPTSRCPASIRKRSQSFQNASGGVLGLFNMFSGGAVERMAIFALNIMPVHFGLDHHPAPHVGGAFAEALKKARSGRKILNQYTRYLTVALAVSSPGASRSACRVPARSSRRPGRSSSSRP